jgi:hypothetical protein
MVDPGTQAFDDGMAITRATLRAWNNRPGPVLKGWLIGAVAAACLLLVAILTIAEVAPASGLAQLSQPPFMVGDVTDAARIFSHNLLVLALHAMACLAGFIAGSSLPTQAGYRSGWRRTVHVRGGQVAIAFVIAATIFSLVVQAETIGTEAGRVALALHTSPVLLLIALMPHAVPELTAMFLPLAAWVIASRKRDWDQLLAATAVTVSIAAPVLVICACWEVFIAPHVVHLLIGHG